MAVKRAVVRVQPLAERTVVDWAFLSAVYSEFGSAAMMVERKAVMMKEEEGDVGVGVRGTYRGSRMKTVL